MVVLMANSDSESYSQAGSSGKQISSSLFSVPGFFSGFGSKASVDSDSLRSPTSPLDFRLFSNLSNPFGFKSISSAETESGRQNKFFSHEVGLGIINSIVVDDCGLTSPASNSNRRKNVIFGPQIKTKISKSSNHCIKSLSPLKSYSLPSNYKISSLSKCKIPSSNSGATTSSVSGNGEFSAFESEPFEKNASFLSNDGSFSSSGIDLTQNSYPSAEHFPLKSSSSTVFSVINNSPEMEKNSLPLKACSLPITIGSNNAYVASLTATEIELSEDYTCIISHGPNPKTTRIFGDCILECHTHDTVGYCKMEEHEIESSLLGSCSEGLGHGGVDANLQKNVSNEEHDIYLCSSQENFAEDKIKKGSRDDCESSAASSYHEDLFIMGLPFAL